MSRGTYFYKLWDGDFRRVVAVYRLRYEPDGLFVERFDPKADAWIEGPGSFLRYVYNGEVGADLIGAREAAALTAAARTEASLPPLPETAHRIDGGPGGELEGVSYRSVFDRGADTPRFQETEE